ncbi:DUF456 domain-containing protein [Marinicrinis sediminis]|uniref:DUF456 domain-containing protein n=1 Tax=Marinicrinis sediminis TaxID=1652465 RepID=A0ABW5RG24_9BACL
MEWLAWILTLSLFGIGMVGIVYPVLPGVVAIYAAFFVYGWLVSFEPFGLWFWLVQTFLLLVIFIADYGLSAASVKRYGGSRASVVGTTIGLILGPFVLPVAGLLIGPLLGAMLGELTQKKDLAHAWKVGLGSLVGLLTSTLMKGVLQTLMIVLFFLWIWF